MRTSNNSGDCAQRSSRERDEKSSEDDKVGADSEYQDIEDNDAEHFVSASSPVMMDNDDVRVAHSHRTPSTGVPIAGRAPKQRHKLLLHDSRTPPRAHDTPRKRALILSTGGASNRRSKPEADLNEKEQTMEKTRGVGHPTRSPQPFRSRKQRPQMSADGPRNPDRETTREAAGLSSSFSARASRPAQHNDRPALVGSPQINFAGLLAHTIQGLVRPKSSESQKARSRPKELVGMSKNEDAYLDAFLQSFDAASEGES